MPDGTHDDGAGRETTLLELDEISKSFGRVVVADRLSLRVAEGEMVGIVGPNGAGKTSLFSLISGDLEPDSGQVRLGGAVVTRQSAAARCRLGIGRTYQVPRPFGAMTVFENVLVAVQQGGGLRRRASYAARRGVARADRAGRRGQQPGRAARACSSASGWSWPGRWPPVPGCCCSTRWPAASPTPRWPSSRRSCWPSATRAWPSSGSSTSCARSPPPSDRLLCLASGVFVGDGAPAEVLALPAVREVFLGTVVTTSLAGRLAGHGRRAHDGAAQGGHSAPWGHPRPRWP